MLKSLLAALLLTLPCTLSAQSAKPAAPVVAPAPQVLMHTTQGDITLELFPDKAPKSVANFLQYVRDGFYDGTVLHRVIPGYLVQGGLYTRELQPKRTRPAVASEADNGLSNLRGTLAVARGADVNSGTAQFFVNLTWGYAVFGKVVKGMDVVDRIATLPTRAQGPFAGDVPTPLVVITQATVLGEDTPAHGTSAPATPTTTPPARKPR